MSKDINELSVQYLWNDSSTICLVIGKDSIIQRANVFAETLIGKKLNKVFINDIFINFDNPKSVIDYLIQPETKKLINIETSSKLPSSYYFQFYDLGSSVLAIGESNSVETEMMKKTFLEINSELNNLTRELQKKNAELKKTNELKDKFLGIAAHDLRNPIGLISSYCELLLEQLSKKITSGQLKMLNITKSSSEFLLHLVDELLDISVIESGRLTLNLEKKNIVELITQNVELNCILAAKKNIHIFFNCVEDIPEILIDKYKIDQVLNNLITNAVKFSFPWTQINLNIFLSGNYVTISVADQGQGIPENEMGNIFKPFEKTSVRSTERERSIGLGLAIVWNIVVGHGGKIWAESEVGRGTTFYFTLPIVK